MKRLTLILVVLLLFVSACSSPAPEPMEPTETSPPTVLDRYVALARESNAPIIVTEVPSLYGKKAILFTYWADDKHGNLIPREDFDQQSEILVDILKQIVDDTEAREIYSFMAFHTRSNIDDKIKRISCVDLTERLMFINDSMENLSKILPEAYFSSFQPGGFLDLYLEQGPAAFQITP